MPKYKDRLVTVASNRVIRAGQYRQMSALELVTKVHALFKRHKWTQGANALNASGLPVSPVSPDAVCWCLRGACIKVLEPEQSVILNDLHMHTSEISVFIANALGFDDPRIQVQWNDTQGRTRSHIMHRLRALIHKYGGDDDPTENEELERDDKSAAA